MSKAIRIYVNPKKADEGEPPIVIEDEHGNQTFHTYIHIPGPCEVLFSTFNPPKGRRVWIETSSEVQTRE